MAKLSAPAAYLRSQGLIVGKGLDYGCGRRLDATLLGMEKFDPYWHPYWFLLTRKYDTITCTYFLNVIESEEKRDRVLAHVEELLKPGGKAYLSVRSDIKLAHYTRDGTWQGNIFLQLPLIKSTRQFRMYLLAKA